MAAMLERRGVKAARQVPMPMRHDGIVIDNAFKIDLLIENRLIVELKSTERLSPIHGKQLLTYLRLAKLPLGLLMNFGRATFKDGLRRIANDITERSPSADIFVSSCENR